MSLDQLASSPELVTELPREALLRLYRQAARLEADLRAQLLRGPGARHHDEGLADADVLSIPRLAALWQMTPAKLRELCRTGLIPARKLGKEWVIPLALLREWARQNPLVDQVAPGYIRSHDAGRDQGAPPQTRPYRVEVRRPDRLPPGHAPKMGSRPAAGQPDGPASDPAAGGGD